MVRPGGWAGKAQAAFLLVAALLAAAAIAGGAYLALRGEEKPLGEPVRLVPADAVAVAEAAPLRRLERRLDSLGGAVAADWAERRRRIWAGLERTFGTADLDAIEREWGVDLDRPVAAAVLAWSNEAPLVLLVPVRAPKVFLGRQARAAGPSAVKTDGRVHAAETAAWAVAGGYAVIGGRPDDVRRVVDVEEGHAPSIADDPAFADRPVGDARVWVRGDPIAAAAREVLEGYGPLVGLFAGDAAGAVLALAEEVVGALDRLEAFAVAVDLDAEAPRLRARFAFDPAWPYLAALEPPPSAFPLLARVPAAPLAWAAQFDAAAVADAAETLARRLLEVAGDEEIEATLALFRAAAASRGGNLAQSISWRGTLLAPVVEAATAEAIRDTAAHAATWAPMMEASMRLAARLARGRATAKRLPPVEIGGARAPGLRVETVRPPAMKPEDLAGFPGEVPRELLKERREVQVFRHVAIGDLVLTAGGADAAAVEDALRGMAAGPAEPAASAPGLRAIRDRLPPPWDEAHLLVVVDPSEAVRTDSAGAPPTAFGAAVRRTAPGLVEAEAVWPAAHIRAFIDDVGPRLRMALAQETEGGD